MAAQRSLDTLLARNDVQNIAQELLGSILSTTIDGIITSGIIVETEAYKAPEDKGSHAFANRRTKRTETLFAPSGTIYVYLCYGLHHLINIVTGPIDTAHAVLIRAIEPLNGVSQMQTRRKLKQASKNLTNGPGKLSQALGITTALDTYPLQSDDQTISLLLPPQPIPKESIYATPRVGIAYAKECAHWPWRFRIKENAWTSLPHEVRY